MLIICAWPRRLTEGVTPFTFWSSLSKLNLTPPLTLRLFRNAKTPFPVEENSKISLILNNTKEQLSTDRRWNVVAVTSSSRANKCVAEIVEPILNWNVVNKALKVMTPNKKISAHLSFSARWLSLLLQKLHYRWLTSHLLIRQNFPAMKCCGQNVIVLWMESMSTVAMLPEMLRISTPPL